MIGLRHHFDLGKKFEQSVELHHQLMLTQETMRTSNIQLPTYKELKEILEHESRRLIDNTKTNLSYGNFEPIINVLKYFGLPSTFFEMVTFQDLGSDNTYKETLNTFNNLSDKILKNEVQNDLKLLLDNLYNYLSEEDTLKKADIIFVFGSKSTLRLETAIRLYKEGFSKKIMISGRGPFYELEKNNKTEAETLGNFALTSGIPLDDLILEKSSITVPDNVKASLNLLDSSNIPHNSFILINSPFSQRRGFAHFNKFSKEGTSFVRKNTDTVSEKFSKDAWYKNEEGVKIILKEFFGLRVSKLINTG